MNTIVEFEEKNDTITTLTPIENSLSSNNRLKKLSEQTKRSIDIVGGVVGVLLLVPITVGIIIAKIVLKDKGSLFYIQERIGKNGKIFKMYKFRSMIEKADEVLDTYLSENEEARIEYEKNRKLTNDPRITPIGKFIRKTSLDEFPQFINVLKGDMSLVGPRPYLPREKESIGDSYTSIIKQKPGITGYWQVSGRSNTSFKKRVELESYYSNHSSLALDLKIFLKTFKLMIFSEGAK